MAADPDSQEWCERAAAAGCLICGTDLREVPGGVHRRRRLHRQGRMRRRLQDTRSGRAVRGRRGMARRRCRPASPDGRVPGWRHLRGLQDPRHQARRAVRRVRVVTVMPDATGPRPVTVSPQDAPRHAGQVVRRVLLRRNIVIDAETAQPVAAAVQGVQPR